MMVSVALAVFVENDGDQVGVTSSSPVDAATPKMPLSAKAQ